MLSRIRELSIGDEVEVTSGEFLGFVGRVYLVGKEGEISVQDVDGRKLVCSQDFDKLKLPKMKRVCRLRYPLNVFRPVHQKSTRRHLLCIQQQAVSGLIPIVISSDTRLYYNPKDTNTIEASLGEPSTMAMSWWSWRQACAVFVSRSLN